jgi:hypothetical protein
VSRGLLEKRGKGVYCEYVFLKILNIGLFKSVNVLFICRAFF